jgi:DNA-binding response OmpR family regulator
MGLRVLLADANELALLRNRSALLDEGFEVFSASSGLDCLSRLQDSRPDVLVMDPRLPWGSGEGIMALLHENRDVPQLPVLILTDGGELPDPRTEFDGCTVMRKPIHPEVLSSIIRTLAEHDKEGTRSGDGKK